MPSKINNHFIKRLQCPVCQSNKLKTLYNQSYESDAIKNYLDDFYNPQGGVGHTYLEGTNYCLKVYLDCNLVFQENIPTDNFMFRLYEQWIDANVVCKVQEQYPLWYHESYANQVVDLVSYFKELPNNLAFLDFGMGWEKWCLIAKAFGCRIYGLELSNARIAYAKNNRLDVLENRDLSKYEFDYINTGQVFEHIPKPLETLQDLIQYLKLDGVIKISVPNENTIEKVLENMNWSAKKRRGQLT